jgi:cysteine desulfurase/selenocysteine lyase
MPMETIYFDNAATSWPKPDSMIEAISRFSTGVGANPGRSGHSMSVEAARIVYAAREAIASLIGANDPLSIVFTRNATEGLNTVLFGLLRPGDHVITSSMEHNSVMRPLRALERGGVAVSVVQCSATGEIAPDDVLHAIGKQTKLIILTHASNVTGTLQPIADIGRIARERGIVFCVDAAQTAGCIPIDVVADTIDILVFTGHKSLYGPQGTGGFYLRSGLETFIEPLMRGGTGSRSEFEEHPEFMPDKFEAGTPNAIGLAGLGAGLEFVAKRGVAEIRRLEMELTGAFLDGLRAIPDAVVYGLDDIDHRTAVISFTIRGLTPSAIASALDERFSIMSRPGLHCAPSAHKTIGTYPQGTVRFSFSAFTTQEQVGAGLEAISRISKEY